MPFTNPVPLIVIILFSPSGKPAGLVAPMLGNETIVIFADALTELSVDSAAVTVALGFVGSDVGAV